MEEQQISFETAKLAKKNGFNVECHYFYCKNKICNYTSKPYHYGYTINANMKNDFGYGKTWSAPTQSLLQKWLREKHNIIISINYNHQINKYCATYEETYFYEFEYEWYNTYEEALEIGLQNALKLKL